MKFKKEKISPEEARKQVSDLIFKVLTESLCVREAIKQFPFDVMDLSVQCAWHALVHYEADEDYRKNDREYTQEQDNYLEMIAFILRDGYPLPQNLINDYNKYYETALIPRSKSFLSWLKSLFRFTI